jgi:1-acyl-sn-glycerol-3-phosphate acyltransferase
VLTASRAAFRLARMALHLLWGVAMASVYSWLPIRVRHLIKARWSRQLLEVLGVRLQATGTPLAGGLFVANHISWLDIFAINALAPTTFLSKDDVRRWPVIGWLAARVGTLFLERGSRSAAQRAREHLLDELRRGSRVGVFPEGTTSFGDQVLPFHGALFQSAIDAAVPVAPMLLRYTDDQGRPSTATAYVGDTSLWQCFRSIVTASGLTAHVTFLPTIGTDGVDRRHLAHHSHQVISHALAKLIPSREVRPDEHRATGISAGPQDAPPSGCHPTGSPNPVPGDSSPA